MPFPAKPETKAEPPSRARSGRSDHETKELSAASNRHARLRLLRPAHLGKVPRCIGLQATDKRRPRYLFRRDTAEIAGNGPDCSHQGGHIAAARVPWDDLTYLN